jgi:hypothetical protein
VLQQFGGGDDAVGDDFEDSDDEGKYAAQVAFNNLTIIVS